MNRKFSHLYFPRIKRRSKYQNHEDYEGYREEIREDCLGRCVYCDAHENEIGGKEQMSLDHFRPKNIFPELEHDPENLVLACKVCNGYKGRKWPAIGTENTYIGTDGFIDPFNEDRNDYVDVDSSGSINPIKDPARYIIVQLRLNRPVSKLLRKKRINNYKIQEKFTRLFDEEIGAIDRMLCMDDITPIEKARFKQERLRLEEHRAMLGELDMDTNLY